MWKTTENSEKTYQEQDNVCPLISSSDEKDLNDWLEGKKKTMVNRGFGRGHVVRQYMSGVGVITERYVPEDMLFYKPGHSSGSHDGSSTSVFSVSSGGEGRGGGTQEERDDDGDELNTILPENCPCYEKWLQEERKRTTGFFRNKLFSSILRFKKKK